MLHTSYSVFCDLVEMGYIPCENPEAFGAIFSGERVIFTKPRQRAFERMFGSNFMYRKSMPVLSNSPLLLSNQVFIFDKVLWITKNAREKKLMFDGDYVPCAMQIYIGDTEPLKAYAKLKGHDTID